MATLDRDEREYKIEAFAERNASWTMSLMLVAGVVYQVISGALSGKFEMDWFLVAALTAGVLAKGISDLVYEKKSL